MPSLNPIKRGTLKWESRAKFNSDINKLRRD